MNTDLYGQYLAYLRDTGPMPSPDDWVALRKELQTDLDLFARLFSSRFLNNLPEWQSADPERIRKYLQRFDSLRRETVMMCYEANHQDTENEEEEEPS